MIGFKWWNIGMVPGNVRRVCDGNFIGLITWAFI